MNGVYLWPDGSPAAQREFLNQPLCHRVWLPWHTAGFE